MFSRNRLRSTWHTAKRTVNIYLNKTINSHSTIHNEKIPIVHVCQPVYSVQSSFQSFLFRCVKCVWIVLMLVVLPRQCIVLRSHKLICQEVTRLSLLSRLQTFLHRSWDPESWLAAGEFTGLTRTISHSNKKTNLHRAVNTFCINIIKQLNQH